jgi:hypothetical protein
MPVVIFIMLQIEMNCNRALHTAQSQELFLLVFHGTFTKWGRDSSRSCISQCDIMCYAVSKFDI